ncbi:hypothetical protein J2R62_18795, partial [Plesiomonas shigelloides]
FPMDSKFYSGTTSNGTQKDEITNNRASFAYTNVSGTRPITVKFREQGVMLVYHRNPNYWDKTSKGNVDNLTLVPIKDDATRVAALLGGAVEVTYPVAPNELERVENGQHTQLVTLPGTRATVVDLHQNTNTPMKARPVRQAIEYALNQ